MNTTRETQIDTGVPGIPGDDIVVESAPETVEVQRVVTSDPLPLPAEGGVIEDVGPRIVTESENVRVEDDGSVSRRSDRVEHNPVRRRRSTLVPALLIILALALSAIATAWYFSQSDTTSVPVVEGLALDDAVTRLQDEPAE